jgi:HEAT repeat protein
LLGAIGDNRAIEPLIKLLTSADGEEPKNGRIRARRAAAEALGKFRDPRARTALVKAIADDPDWEVYHAARQALYRMDAQTSYPGYDDLRTTVALAVTEIPEPPEGAKEAIRKWHEHNQGPQVQSLGPILEDYASSLDIERARDAVVENAKAWNPDRFSEGKEQGPSEGKTRV